MVFMLDWAKKKIYKTSKKISEKFRSEEDEKQEKQERIENFKCNFPSTPDIVSGTSPWKIVESPEGQYKIYVYRFDHGQWNKITECSNAVLGVDNNELQRILREKFNGCMGRSNYYSGMDVYFSSEAEAQTCLDEIEPYYESYHLPRAMISRLSLYDEGGYPPYFKDSKYFPSSENLEELSGEGYQSE